MIISINAENKHLKNPVPIHNKYSQQIRERRELPNLLQVPAKPNSYYCT